MLASAGIVLIAILISLLEVPRLMRQKWKKELITFSVLMLFATGLSIAKALRFDIPNPLDWISWVYKPVSDWLMNLLK